LAFVLPFRIIGKALEALRLNPKNLFPAYNKKGSVAGRRAFGTISSLDVVFL
jgi:hypothetical protein